MINRTLTGILILNCCLATPALCDDSVHGADGEPLTGLLTLFGVVGLAAAVAALAIKMVRGSH